MLRTIKYALAKWRETLVRIKGGETSPTLKRCGNGQEATKTGKTGEIKQHHYDPQGEGQKQENQVMQSKGNDIHDGYNLLKEARRLKVTSGKEAQKTRVEMRPGL